MLFLWAVDEGPVQCWDVVADATMPHDLRQAIDTADDVVFANSMFDRTVLRLSKNLRVEIPQEKWFDTMVQALVHSLPGSLEKLGTILRLDEAHAKQGRGRELIQLFCKPRPKNSLLRRATPITHPGEWLEFVEYGKHDVTAMREIKRGLPVWNYRGFERELWNLDQKINDRGMCIDQDLAKSAVRAVAREQKVLAKRTRASTLEEVASATQRDAMLRYILLAYGVELPDMQKATLERRIQDVDLPIELRELLGIRLMSASASTSKYMSLMKGISSDGRLRGTLQFAGAKRTGRWAGRLFQPHNLPSRGVLKHAETQVAIEAMKADVDDLVLDNVMLGAASAIRGCIIAPPFKKLVIADFSNIEGRDQAWLAGEEWKLQAFRDYDAGTGPDLYKLAYAKAFRVPIESVTKEQRQIGKVMELMLGYEGGVGAFMTGALTYGFDLEELGRIAEATIPKDVMAETRGFLDWLYKKEGDEGRRLVIRHGLSERAFMVIDSLKRMWRRAHPFIVAYWKTLATAVRNAVKYPTELFTCGTLKIQRDGKWLRIRLPSGRYLCYPQPQVDESGTISYVGEHQYTRKWTRLNTYGGKLFENVCQAVARDFMAWAMPPAEAAGYEIILTVHDELVTEAPDSPDFSVGGLCAILSQTPAWAEGMPLAAAGFETCRYRKED